MMYFPQWRAKKSVSLTSPGKTGQSTPAIFRLPFIALFEGARFKAGMNNYQKGQIGEWMAACLLRLKGYKIVAKRCRMRGGEIDLIGLKGRTVVFIEVKTRNQPEQAAIALGHFQCTRIHKAAEQWLARHDPTNLFDVRFDLLLVSNSLLPKHLTNAF